MNKNQRPQDEEEEEEEGLDHGEEEGEEGEESQNQDGDFDFNERKKKDEKNKNDFEKAQVIQNNHFDEAHELSDQNSDEYKSGDDNKEREEPDQKQEPKRPGNQKAEALQKKDESDDEGGKKSVKIIGIYDPSDYTNLNVTTEITELFKYITRYKPVQIELETKLKAFTPEYIPAVGEVDAFIKMPRPDNQTELLGLLALDEPTLNQSKKAIIDIYWNQFNKNNGKNVKVHSIEFADKNPKEITTWINSVSDLHKNKPPPSVNYQKMMPEIDTLMQVWPAEIEDALANLMIPSEEIDLSLSDYCKFACSFLDIPVHDLNNNKNIIESLHVFFTLFSEFKENQHFQQQQKTDSYGHHEME